MLIPQDPIGNLIWGNKEGTYAKNKRGFGVENSQSVIISWLHDGATRFLHGEFRWGWNIIGARMGVGPLLKHPTV